jgi:hypothetical protein
MFHFVGHRRAFRLNAATGVVGVGVEPAHQPEDQGVNVIKLFFFVAADEAK